MELINDLAKLVSKAAPTIGSLFGTPLAGIGISLLSDAFGGDADKLLTTISNNPDAILKLKELEAKHSENILIAKNALYQTEVDDRKNARSLEMQTNSYFPSLLATGFLIIYSAIQFYCVTHNNSVNDIISARLQDVLIMIMSYYFGSSHKEKMPSL